MSDDSCVSGPEIRRLRGRRIAIIVIILAGLGYTPALLFFGTPSEVVVATVPAVIPLTIEAIRRLTLSTGSGGPAGAPAT